MVFSPVIFLFPFFPIALGGYYLTPTIRLKNLWLLFTSLWFYAWGEFRYLPLLGSSIALNYAFGLLIARFPKRGRPRFLALALAAQDPTRLALPVEHLRWFEAPPLVGDLTKLMGLPAIGGDPVPVPDVSSIAAHAPPRRGKLLLIADSFFGGLLPYFEMQFEKVKHVHRETSAVRGVLVEPSRSTAERFDVVILESVERYWTMA
jgi:hypothetical protein